MIESFDVLEIEMWIVVRFQHFRLLRSLASTAVVPKLCRSFFELPMAGQHVKSMPTFNYLF
jgi:hypothetical protein